MVESRKITFIRVEGKCPEKLTANLSEISGVKTKLILGRSSKTEKVDIDFETKESQVSRIHAELFYRDIDKEQQTLLIRQIGSSVCGFVIQDNQKIPFQLLLDYAIDIGGKVKLWFEIESIYPWAQIKEDPAVFSPQIAQTGLTRSGGVEVEKKEKAHLQLNLVKYIKQQKNRRSLDLFEANLDEKKIFTIKNDSFESGELNVGQNVDLELEYNGEDKNGEGLKYWCIRSKPGAEKIVIHCKLNQHLTDKDTGSPGYIIQSTIYGDNYKPRMMFGTCIYDTEW